MKGDEVYQTQQQRLRDKKADRKQRESERKSRAVADVAKMDERI